MIVGLTGGIGSGKTTVVQFFQELSNIAVYIADSEAKKLMNSSVRIQSKMIKEFGKEAYKNNQLNRTYIANIVFKNKQKLAVLNAIVHPEVEKHFQEFIIKNKDKSYILYENAILFENQSNFICDFIITVSAPLETRIQRVMERDKSTKEVVLDRIKNQWTEDKKMLQSNYVIENTSLENTKNQVIRIHNILTEKQL
ncbi:MAG: dephospho-CoA kinase [Polaribacter sp.]